MTPHTRSIFIKIIMTCASICLGAFIAFKFFRTGVQEVVDAPEIVQSSSPSLPKKETDLIKTDTQEEQALAELPADKRDAIEAEEKELDAIQAHIKKDHQKTQPYEAPCPTCQKHAQRLTDQETVIAGKTQAQPKKSDAPLAKKPEPKKQETKKPALEKPSTAKAPEKKPVTVKPQEPKDKKVQPMTPSKTTGPATIEKPTVVAPAKTEPAKPATPKQAAKPMVTVKNNIRKDMTGYKKFGKNWYPDEYSVTINGVRVDEGDEIMVPAGDGSVCNVVFAYDFRPMGKSYKKGTEEVSYVLKPGTQELAITFSWYKTPCIIVTPFVEQGAGNQVGSKAQGA